MATFGWTNFTSPEGATGLTDRIGYTGVGALFQCPSNGVADSITLNWKNSGSSLCKCAIYNSDKTGPITNGITEERTLPDSSGGYVPYTFNFTGTKPIVVKSTSYILAFWTDDGGIAYEGETGYTVWNDLETYGGSWPATLATDVTNTDYVLHIYCTLTVTGSKIKPWDENVPDALSYYGFNLR